MGKRGGARPGAGRPPKAKELKLIEEFDAHINPGKVIKELINIIQNEKQNKRLKFDAIKLYLEYRVGKPTASIDISSSSGISIDPVEWVGNGKPKFEYKLNGSN